MHLKTEGLVLRQTNYQDHDLLLTVLTKDYGRMTLRARGVKGKRSKLKSGCQLLAYAEFTIFENRGFCTVQEAAPLELFLPLRSDLELLSLASYFAYLGHGSNLVKTTNALDMMRTMDGSAYTEYQKISKESSNEDRQLNALKYLGAGVTVGMNPFNLSNT